MSDEMLEFIIAIGTLVVLYIGLVIYGYFLRGTKLLTNNMKNYFAYLKKQSWRKIVAELITSGTMLVIGCFVLIVVLFLAFLALSSLWHAYKESPTPFHYLDGFLATIGAWIWAWDWAERQ